MMSRGLHGGVRVGVWPFSYKLWVYTGPTGVAEIVPLQQCFKVRAYPRVCVKRWVWHRGAESR